MFILCNNIYSFIVYFKFLWTCLTLCIYNNFSLFCWKFKVNTLFWSHSNILRAIIYSLLTPLLTVMAHKSLFLKSLCQSLLFSIISMSPDRIANLGRVLCSPQFLNCLWVFFSFPFFSFFKLRLIYYVLIHTSLCKKLCNGKVYESLFFWSVCQPLTLL